VTKIFKERMTFQLENSRKSCIDELILSSFQEANDSYLRTPYGQISCDKILHIKHFYNFNAVFWGGDST
jgi:hypothetical protein